MNVIKKKDSTSYFLHYTEHELINALGMLFTFRDLRNPLLNEFD